MVWDFSLLSVLKPKRHRMIYGLGAIFLQFSHKSDAYTVNHLHGFLPGTSKGKEMWIEEKPWKRAHCDGSKLECQQVLPVLPGIFHLSSFAKSLSVSLCQ